jgi:cytochrome oxidase Cu insertion factor (SCO1/SenC/PrrC family)
MRLFRSACRVIPALGCFLAVSAVTVGAEPPAKSIEIGKAAPKFELKDQHGKVQSLNELRKQGPVAIVFFRSARW